MLPLLQGQRQPIRAPAAVMSYLNYRAAKKQKRLRKCKAVDCFLTNFKPETRFLAFHNISINHGKETV